MAHWFLTSSLPHEFNAKELTRTNIRPHAAALKGKMQVYLFVSRNKMKNKSNNIEE